MLGFLVLLVIVLVSMALAGFLTFLIRRDLWRKPLLVAMALVVLGVGLFALRAGPDTLAVHEEAYTEMRSTSADLEVSAPGTRADAAPVLVVPFLAEVYPTQTQAAEALAELLIYRLTLRLIDPADAEADVVEHLLVAGPAPEPVRRILAEALAEHPTVKSVHRAEGDFSDRWDVRVTVDTRRREGETVLVARAEMDMDRPLDPVAAEIAWVDKPWAGHFGIWQQQRAEDEPGVEYAYLYSGQPVPEIRQAEQGNLDRLSAGLLEPVRNEIRRLIAAGRLDELADAARSVQLEALGKALAEMRPSWQADRFVQRFDRDYAELVSVHVLVRLRQEWVETLAMQTGRLVAGQTRLARAARARRITGRVRLYLAAAALVLAVAMVYLVANAATKGYYLWRLRLASLACIAAGLVVLVRFLQP